jgi:hypothetical protein
MICATAGILTTILTYFINKNFGSPLLSSLKVCSNVNNSDIYNMPIPFNVGKLNDSDLAGSVFDINYYINGIKETDLNNPSPCELVFGNEYTYDDLYSRDPSAESWEFSKDTTYIPDPYLGWAKWFNSTKSPNIHKYEYFPWNYVFRNDDNRFGYNLKGPEYYRSSLNDKITPTNATFKKGFLGLTKNEYFHYNRYFIFLTYRGTFFRYRTIPTGYFVNVSGDPDNFISDENLGYIKFFYYKICSAFRR